LGENPIAWADVMNTPGPDSDAVKRNGDGWEVELTDRTDDFDFVYDDQAFLNDLVTLDPTTTLEMFAIQDDVPRQ